MVQASVGEEDWQARAAPVATGFTGGILRNRNEESPIDRDAFRRMSATAIAGGPAGQPARAYEKWMRLRGEEVGASDGRIWMKKYDYTSRSLDYTQDPIDWELHATYHSNSGTGCTGNVNRLEEMLVRVPRLGQRWLRCRCL